MTFTFPRSTPVSGNNGHLSDHTDIYNALVSAVGVNAQNTAYSGGATGNGTSNDQPAIQAALNTGALVFLPPTSNFYSLNAPLVIPSGGGLFSTRANVLSLNDYGAILKPSASFSGTGVISLANGTEEAQVRDILIDGSSSAASVGGIVSAGSNYVYLRNVYMRNLTGSGVVQNSTDVGWYAERVVSHALYGNGFSLAGSDATWIGCKALGCGTGGTYDGWAITTGVVNTKLIGCASEWSSGNGYNLTGAFDGTGSGALSLTNCSTDRNTKNGFMNVATSGIPVQLTGCSFRRDGRNAGSGGGSYAGIGVAAATAPTQISGCVTVPGVDDNGTGTNSPEYGLSITSSSQFVKVDNSYLWGNTAGYYDDGSNTLTMIDPGTLAVTGTTGSPSVHDRQGTKVLVAGAGTVTFPYVLATSRIILTVVIPGGTVGSPYINTITAGTGFSIKSTSSTDTSTVAWAAL